MTIAAPQPAPDVANHWLDHLRSQLRSDWHPTEWDVEEWLFIGDPDVSTTYLRACGTKGCTRFSAHPTCSSCVRLAATHTDPQELHRRLSEIETKRGKWRTSRKRTGNFDLKPLLEPYRTELLYALQQDDLDGYSLHPMPIAGLVKRTAACTSMLDPAWHLSAVTASQPTVRAIVNRLLRHIRRAWALLEGQDPTLGDVWDMYLVGLSPDKHSASRHRKLSPLDFTQIRQPWLREATKNYVRDARPKLGEARTIVKSITFVSDALALRPGGDDPATAGVSDITRAVELIRAARPSHTSARRSGPARDTFHPSSQQHFLGCIRLVLDYARKTGYLAGVPVEFSVLPRIHVIRGESAFESREMLLPRRALDQIHSAIGSYEFRMKIAGAALTVDQATRMLRCAMRVLVDTGRRPSEVTTLGIDCVKVREADGGAREYTLIYDNHKAGRRARTLPIPEATALAIQEWRDERLGLSLPESEGYLFPPTTAGRVGIRGALPTPALRAAVQTLRRQIGQLESDDPDPAAPNTFLPYTGRIVPYMFRHAYAQRHADADVPIDTLRVLMDHRNISTTQGYYSVSEERKRKAVALVSQLTVDRSGQSAPRESIEAYEIGMVSVPYGGCSNPTNVQAGGQSCPIRFQCVGCDYYRPDPTYLPAIKDLLGELRADLALVEAKGMAADYVVQGMREEIGSYRRLIERLEDVVSKLNADQRAQVEDATRLLRGGRTLLPLSVAKQVEDE